MTHITTRSARSIPALHSNYFFILALNMVSYRAESYGWLTQRQGESRCASRRPSWAHSSLSSHTAWSSLHKRGRMARLILALALGRGCTWETLKGRLHSRAFPWTTRWQFPISKGGSGYLLAAAQQLQSQAELRHICLCCPGSWGAVSDGATWRANSFAPVHGNTGNFHRHPQGAEHLTQPSWTGDVPPPHRTHPEFYEEESILRPLPKELLQAALLFREFVINLTNVHRLEQGVAVRMVGVSNVHEEVFIVLQGRNGKISTVGEEQRVVRAGGWALMD